MIEIRKAKTEDLNQLDTLDRYMSYDEIKKKISDGLVYIVAVNERIIGCLRYGLFWDHIPFMYYLFFTEDFRRRGFGSKLVDFWEKDMQVKGHQLVMTSTQADEGAQHFYRKLGYKDIGGFVLPKQALELIMLKMLEG